MLPISHSLAAASSGLSALGVNLSSLIIQLLTFIIAYLVLRKWAFKPILRILNQRRETIERGVQLGEQMQKDKAALEQKIADTLQKARADADKILSEAHDVSRQTIQEAEEAARQKAEGLLKAADDRIKQDMAVAEQRLKKQLTVLVAEATEAIIHEKVDSQQDTELINAALKEGAAK